MSVKTSIAASHCPQCGCAVLPCPGCGKLLKDGTILCVSCGYHLQLGRHVGASPNGSNGAANPHAPNHAHVSTSSGSTQDYIASLLGANASSQSGSPARKLSAPISVVGGMPAGNTQTAGRSFKFTWPSWLTFPRRKASAAAAAMPQTFARPQPGMPPYLVGKPVVHVPAKASSADADLDVALYMVPTILLAIGLMGIGWFAWSGGGVPGLVIGTGLLLTVLLSNTVWNAVVMNFAGWLLEYDFGPLSLGLYRLFAHAVFTVGISLATIPLARLTGAPVGLWAICAPFVSFAMFCMLFDLEWLDAIILFAVMVFITALFHTLALGILHTANSVKFEFGGTPEAVAPRQGARSESSDDGGDVEVAPAPVRAGAAEIRNPEPPVVQSNDAPAKASPDSQGDASKGAEPPKSDPSKTDTSKEVPAQEKAAASENATPVNPAPAPAAPASAKED